ncbi:zinc finger (Ran-binding) family protein [Rhynchospora pubera]|uniref:Zinc finger (Ran-binding) family protein n=1 Tax=Rhynchospora pubera TaxID=906938 RepID=A0AAV8CWB1_9POAL|nr:zinc finger (Ran-binding) family protein [Rhynchospora pubera]
MGGEGREGDWECGGCGNRNYAFRSLCNRCKQPRLLVDTKTPRDSKWLPRIGDWICSGCSNNNYASRTSCKKCNLSREEAAVPALALPGMSLLPSYAQYLSRQQQGLKTGLGSPSRSHMQSAAMSAGLGWMYGAQTGSYGLHSPTSANPSSNHNWGFSGTGSGQFLGLPKDWRDGDWMCVCGFHNYSSRDQCKKCNAPMPSGAPSTEVTTSVSETSSTLGIKRLASDDFASDWESKRLNAGQSNGHEFFGNGNSVILPQVQISFPAPIGKGAKQWRDGDWMCGNCNNHNYASRTHCNRCKTMRDGGLNPGTVL